MDGVDAVLERFEGQQYIADRSIGMAVFLAVRMGKPLLVEGEPGCGKTEIARTLASALMTVGTRMQGCEIVEQTLGFVVRNAQDLQTMQSVRQIGRASSRVRL